MRLAEVNAPDDQRVAGLGAARLRELVSEAGDGLELVHTGAERDRYDRAVAHVEYDRGDERVWVQGVLVSEGLLIAASRADNRVRIARLLALEGEARDAGAGGWASGAFTVRDPDPNRLAQHLDSYQIVAGRIIDTARAGSGRVYLNFGLDWRTDFTVSIRAGELRRFEAAGLDPLELEGREVRVRGWLYEENGPMIAIDHPEAIEILDSGLGE